MNRNGLERTGCFLSLVFFLFLRLAPQAEGIGFVHTTRNEGLSRNSVGCILQDRNGFIWFATEAGLNKFDGNDITVSRHDPANPASLSNDYILSIYEDREGSFWVGTFNGGLNRRDPTSGEFRHYRHAPGRADSLSSDIVSIIHEDRAGTLWFGSDEGLNRFDRRTGSFRRYPLATDRPGRSSHIHDLCEDRDGVFWIATYGGGLCRFEPASGKFVLYRNDPAAAGSLSHDFVNCVHEDREGILWIGTENGLNRLERRSGRFTLVPLATDAPGAPRDDSIQAICEDQSGMLWIGTREGLVRLNPRTGSSTRIRSNPSDAKSLSSDWIASIFEDSSGIIWIGTWDGGINRFNPNQKKFVHHRSIPGRADSLGNNQVCSFWEDPAGMLWIGTVDGLDRFDRANGSYAHFRALPGDPEGFRRTAIRVILPDRSGNLWLATDGGGLKFFDRRNGRVTVFRSQPGNPNSLSYDRIRTMCEDRAGILWIGTLGGGLDRLDRESRAFTHYRFAENDPASLSDNVVRAILEDRAGTLWIGTHGGGLNRFEPATGKFTRFRHDAGKPASLNNDFIFCIHEDEQANLWIGTWGGGLNKLDRDKGTFSHFTTADGMANNNVSGIQEDPSGNLWLATNEGLSRFTPRTGQFRNYDVSDGLQGREFITGSAYQSPSGEMFFGGTNGFNAFFPQNIYDNRFVPPVRITSFKVLNKEVKLPRPIWETAQIELSPKDYLFSFEFAALDYTAPEKNKYAYKLEGLTDDWIHTDARHRTASFSLLPPGRYVFRVKGSNSDGIWNEEDVSLVIRVHGPWWRSWWFLSLLAALLFLALYEWKRTSLRRLAAKIRTEAAMEEMFNACNITPREREITLLMLKGHSNKEIEARLFIELSTVKIHVHHIFKKLGVQSRTQLMRLFQNLQIK